MGNHKGNIIKPSKQANNSAADNPVMGSVTSSFLVSIGDLLSSTVDGYDTFAPLLWFTSTEERVNSGKSAGDFKASATLVHSLLELHIPTDSYMPTLRQALRDNSNVSEVKIVRLGHSDGTENTEIYSSTFEDCKVEAIEEVPDKLIVRVRVFTRSDEAIEVNTTGAPGPANTASGWDYSTNKSTA